MSARSELSEQIPAVLQSQAEDGTKEYRVAVLLDHPRKIWDADGARGSYNLAGTFDASEVYTDDVAAIRAMDALAAARTAESGGRLTFGKRYEFLARRETFARIRRDAITWMTRQGEINRARERNLLPE